MKKLYLCKTLALLLCAVLCAGLLPAAFADENASAANGADYPFRAPALGGVVYLNDGVHLSWNYVSEAPRYGVFRKTNGGPWRGIMVGNSLSYTDPDVEPGSTYTYTVCVVSSDRKSILSPYDPNGLSITIPSGIYAPVQVRTPILLDAQNVDGGVRVRWEPVNGASKYGIFRKTNGGPWHGLAVSVTEYFTDTSVVPGATYTYTVCCLAADNRTLESAYDQNGRTVTAGAVAAPAAQFQTPALLDARNAGQYVNVSWRPVSGAPQYGVFRSTDGGPWRGIAVITETNFTDKGVEPGRLYTYTVCCVSADGKSLVSAYDEDGISVWTEVPAAESSLFALQPKDQTARQMTYAGFTARAAGAQVNYRWEMQAKGSAEWYVLPEIARLIGGVNSETLIIAAVRGLDGYSFRCLVSDGQRAEYSDTVTLHVTA